MMIRRTMLATVVLLAGTTAAQAQSGYVGAAIAADIVRTGSFDGTAMSGTGEAVSFALRAAAPVTPRFGVEFEFARPAAIERDESPDVRILADLTGFDRAVAPALPPESAIFSYDVHTWQRNTTMTAAMTVAQPLSSRVSLVYLGGVAFGRIERRFRYSYGFPPYLAAIYPVTSETKGVTYEAGPMVGVEGRVGLTEHVQLAPGVRMVAIGEGWVVRPSVGLNWRF
jgi:hypothetical protein